jgi:hypothetical protein
MKKTNPQTIALDRTMPQLTTSTASSGTAHVEASSVHAPVAISTKSEYYSGNASIQVVESSFSVASWNSKKWIFA